MNLSGIDVNLVVALHALLTERHVTRAARRLGLGQSATSHALSRLREHFDDPLLVRVGRELRLTARGTALLGPTASAVGELERVFAPPAAFDPRTARRRFRIAATDNLELYVLPRLAALLEREAPHVDLRFHHLPRDWPVALGRGDFELKLGRKAPVTSPLLSEDLGRDRLVCVARRGHPAPAKLTLAQYASLSHLLVSPGESGPGAMDLLLEKHGLSRRIAISLPHFVVALFVVATSDHVLTVPARLVEATRGALRLRMLTLPGKPSEYGLAQVWSRAHDADPGHRWLRAAIKRSLAPLNDGIDGRHADNR